MTGGARGSRRPPALPDVLPLFPLPHTVFFPGTVIPLRVFEPRYVQLVKDAPRLDRWLAIPQLMPGFEEDYHRSPSFYAVAGAGRLTDMKPGEDGTFLVQVEGIVLVRLQEVESDRPYRRAKATLLEEDPAWLTLPEAEPDLVKLLEIAARTGLVTPEERASGIPASPIRRRELINRLAGRVLAEPEERQSLLEAAEYRQRVRLLLRQTRLMDNTVQALARVPKPDDPSVN